MIDLHTHSFLSDGELVPEELVVRCEQKGYRFLAITDHVGFSNVETIIPQIVKMCRSLRGKGKIKVLPGAEVTHVRPELMIRAVALARKAGAKIVIGHGESIVEPLLPGTNRALIEAGVDIVAHPGLITEADARLAAKKGVYLEISGRKGHSLTNGHIANMARAVGAGLIFGSDGHAPGDYPSREEAERMAMGAGLTQDEVQVIFANAEKLFRAAGSRKRPAGRKTRVTRG